jgi:hypothetical protein
VWLTTASPRLSRLRCQAVIPTVSLWTDLVKESPCEAFWMIVILLGIAAASAAHGHASLEHASPLPGSTVSDVPKEIVVLRKTGAGFLTHYRNGCWRLAGEQRQGPSGRQHHARRIKEPDARKLQGNLARGLDRYACHGGKFCFSDRRQMIGTMHDVRTAAPLLDLGSKQGDG